VYVFILCEYYVWCFHSEYILYCDDSCVHNSWRRAEHMLVLGRRRAFLVKTARGTDTMSHVVEGMSSPIGLCAKSWLSVTFLASRARRAALILFFFLLYGIAR
jgi:hypothetical protein